MPKVKKAKPSSGEELNKQEVKRPVRKTPKVKEILKEDEKKHKKERLNSGVKGWNRYPWKTWFAQKSFVLKRMKHFKHQTWIMAQQIRNNATKFKVRVSISIPEEGESVVVKVHNPLSLGEG